MLHTPFRNTQSTEVIPEAAILISYFLLKLVNMYTQRMAISAAIRMDFTDKNRLFATQNELNSCQAIKEALEVQNKVIERKNVELNDSLESERKALILCQETLQR